MKFLFLLFFVIGFAQANEFESLATKGKITVNTEYLEMVDKVRNRSIPIKIYWPEIANAVPAVIFSHGLGGSREGGEAWGAHWASYGIASVHVQHLGSDETLWKGKARMEGLLAMRNAMGADQLFARVADVRFVLSQLTKLEYKKASINTLKIGMAGHSFGAITTQSLMGQQFAAPSSLEESKFLAGLAFSPSGRINQGIKPEQAYGKMSRPFMGITGTKDGDPFNAADTATALSRVAIIRAMPAPHKFLLNIDGADHMSFNGAGVGTAFWSQVKAASTAFWLAFLNEDKNALKWLQENKYLAQAGVFEAR